MKDKVNDKCHEMTNSHNHSDCLPQILVYGFHGKEEMPIIRGILDVTVPSPEYSVGHHEKYKWTIENKYYNTEVQFLKLIDKSLDSVTNIDSLEALIMYIDPFKELALEDLEQVLSHLKPDSDLKFLVCDGFTNKTVAATKSKMQEWCISHCWELIELNVEDNEEQYEVDDFVESNGFVRLKEALHAHTWPNLQLHDLNSKLNQFQKLQKEDSSQDYECMLGDSDEDFLTLFSNLGQMKETADTLPPEERREYAARIATTFLKALGDEEEL